MMLSDEQIGAELRALRPTPSEPFSAELDAWAAAGFPSSSALTSRPEASRHKGPSRLEAAARRLRGRRGGLPRPALVAAASLFVVAVVAIAVGQSGSGGELASDQVGTAGDGSAAPSTAAPPGAALDKGTAGRAESAPSGTVEQVPSGGTAIPPDGTAISPAPAPPNGERPRNGRPQVQERTASLGLSTDPGHVQDVADGVVEVTDRYQGFVDSSSVQATGERGRASFALRIPTSHLRDALANLSDLAHVTSRNEGSVNVTGDFVSAGERFSDARASVNALLADLEDASSASEIASIRQQLAAARPELAAARSELRGLKQRVALTPVNVTVAAHGDGSAWSIGDAADDAVDVLEAIGGAVLVTLAVLVPLAALSALGWLGLRELRRRRREAPLDS
jgi:uncharacterized protein DUF4349